MKQCENSKMSQKLDLKTVSELLTEDVLKQVVVKLYSKKQGSIIPDIINYTVKFASEKGEGYLGTTYRILVNLSNESSISMIAKGMPANIVRRKTFEIENFFENEVHFFNKVVPVFQELEMKQRGKKACEEDSLLSIPACYYALADGLNDFLLLEDLCEEGFGLAERSAALDIVYTESLLKVVARFHAFSYAMKFLSPDKFQTLISTGVKETFLSAENEKRLTKYMHNLATLMHRAIKDELQDTKYLKKFEDFIEEEIFYKNMLKSIELREPAVINHGDCWVSNFMFKDSGSKAKVIDFQIVRHGSPVLDISMFVFSCLTEEQLTQMGGSRTLLQTYYRELLTAVEALGAPSSCALTLEELQQHWRQSGVFGLASAIELVPLALVEHDDVQDLDRMEGTEAVPLEQLSQFKEITSDTGKKRLAGLVRLAVDEGML